MEVTEAMTETPRGKLLLGVDTCGPVGSVALGRLTGRDIEILGQIELEGRSYSARLVAAIGELLAASGTKLSLLHAMVAVNGPGSFTGVRVGLSAVKGLAEPGGIPVVAVSRLEVLAWKGGSAAAALDAHRQEVFLRVGEQELLVGVKELAEFDFAMADEDAKILDGQRQSRLPIPSGAEARTLPSKTFSVAVCDEAAAGLLATVWPDVQLVNVRPPTAADALRLCVGRVEAGHFADLELLDGHYLRRSDAEIFGDAPKPKSGEVEGA